MASPIEGLAGLGFHITRQPDGTLEVRKVELEPRERRRTTLTMTLTLNGIVLVLGALMFGLVPTTGEATEAFPGAGKLFLGLFGLMGLSMLQHLIWTRLGREVWLVGRNRLEVRQSLLGFRRRRTHTDTELVLRCWSQNTWALGVTSKPHGLLLRGLDPAKLSALFDLGELLARETGWTLRAPERPSEAASRTAPGAPPIAVPSVPQVARERLVPLHVDAEHARRIVPDLEPGERLLWTGQPDAKRMARQILPILVFGVPWTLIAIGFGHPWSLDRLFDNLFSGVFVLVGLLICSSPLAIYRTAQQTYYAITDRRVLILTEGKRRKLELYRPTDLCETVRDELVDGSGDLLFARRQEKDSDGDLRTVDVKFVGVPQVRAVERLLRQLFEGEAGTPR